MSLSVSEGSLRVCEDSMSVPECPKGSMSVPECLSMSLSVCIVIGGGLTGYMA